VNETLSEINYNKANLRLLTYLSGVTKVSEYEYSEHNFPWNVNQLREDLWDVFYIVSSS